jgi:hypothetical protein
MKTRVGKYFDVTAGVWLFYVQQWAEPRTDWATYNIYNRHGGSTNPVPILPEGFVNWPWEHRAAFETPDEQRARRVAKDLSEGKDVEPSVIVAEFSDGVEFKPI